jgi:hypothetical protein
LFGPDVAVCFCDHLFTSVSDNWDTDEFILSLFSKEPVADYGLDHPAGIANTCHFLIVVTHKHLLSVANENLMEDYFNRQSGHSPDITENYTISIDRI